MSSAATHLRRPQVEHRIRTAQRIRFTALALDLAACRRGAPGALTHDPQMIARWSRELRARWASLSPADRTLINGDLAGYGVVAPDPGAKDDAEEALRLLVAHG